MISSNMFLVPMEMGIKELKLNEQVMVFASQQP